MAKRSNKMWGIPMIFPESKKEKERIRMWLRRNSKNKIELITNADMKRVLNEEELENCIEDMRKGLKTIKMKNAQKTMITLGYILLSIGMVKATYIITYF